MCVCINRYTLKCILILLARISGAYITNAIIKLSFVMIPQVDRTVMQQEVRETSSIFKAIKILAGVFERSTAQIHLHTMRIRDYAAHPHGAINTNSVEEETTRVAN